MTTYPNSIGGPKKKIVLSFSRLAIIGFLLITLITAILTYQLGHEMAVQLAGNAGSRSEVQPSSPTLNLPATGSGVPASSNPPMPASATNSAPSASTAKTQTAKITRPQQVQPKPTTKAS
jgi:cytoskeletal protein RodZ